MKPSHYDLQLDLNPTDMTYKGNVTVQLRKTSRPSKRLTFHAKDVTVHSATVTRVGKHGEESFEVDRINLHKAYDEVRLHSPKLLHAGEYVVTLSFSAKITDPMNGVYPCYFSHDGKEKKLLATQFESHHAREVFPCIDEPEAKATFDLTLSYPKGSGSVLANTPIKSESVKNGTVTAAFETTPIMSTYLLAFVHGEVGYLEAQTSRGTIVRTYATPDNVAYTDFALETAVKCLEFYEDYFAIPYPLAKADMIALPDFASGAMENWGLITYREQTLLVDPDNTSLPTKQYVAMVVAHELAHQWFGNLVTMRWWTDLWLNEGFASWIEYLAIDKLFPEWQMWTQFIASEQQPALKLDALDNTHPVEVTIRHPDEIRTIFDAISYNKGASVIHMLHGYLGAETFRDGLRHYLKSHAYGNAETADLWAALEKISGKPVKAFMHAWTSLPGFPVVRADLSKNSLQLSQERFYAQKPSNPAQSVWPVPLLSEPLSASFDTHKQTLDQSGKPRKINIGQSGFYRTIYDTDYLQAIMENLTNLEPLDRLGLLADSFETAKAGYHPASESLELLHAYAQEDNAAVWEIIAGSMGELRRTMDDDKLRELMKPFIRSLTSIQLKRLGWEESTDDSYFDKLLRPIVLGMSAAADEPETVRECIKRFNAAKNSEYIAADLRSLVYNTAARHGDEKTFQKLLDFHEATRSSEERTTLSAALTGFEQPELIDRALALVQTKTVRRQDAMYWIAYSFMNRHAKQAAWKWLQDNWGWLDKELGSDLSFYRTPIYAARSFSDESFLGEYEAFFKPRISPALERSIKQGQEMLETQIAWKQRDLKGILAFFKK